MVHAERLQRIRTPQLHLHAPDHACGRELEAVAVPDQFPVERALGDAGDAAQGGGEDHESSAGGARRGDFYSHALHGEVSAGGSAVDLGRSRRSGDRLQDHGLRVVDQAEPAVSG